MDWVEELSKWWNKCAFMFHRFCITNNLFGRTLFKNEDGREGSADRSEHDSTSSVDGLARMHAQAASRAAVAK